MFKNIFDRFLEHKKNLKIISVASADSKCRPNSAHKMLVDVIAPNEILFLDYKFTQTFSNINHNPQLSISFMDDAAFTGYRLTGNGVVLDKGAEYEQAKASWSERLVSCEADRIIKRLTGHYSTREAENNLPKNFVIVKFIAEEASMIKPDRVFRASLRTPSGGRG